MLRACVSFADVDSHTLLNTNEANLADILSRKHSTTTVGHLPERSKSSTKIKKIENYF